MKTETEVRLLTVYVNNTEQWHGHPLYSAIVKLCQDEGIAGATVIRCVEGYGSHHKLHSARLFELSETLPVQIDIVDEAGRIDALLTKLEPMVPHGMLIVQPVKRISFSTHTP
jgi:PII-like signaling protein